MWKCEPQIMVKLLNQLREKCRVGGMAPQKSEDAAQGLLAAYIARKVPCNPDVDRPIGPYYAINVQPIVNDAVSAINEMTPINVEKVSDAIFAIWRSRAEVVLGTYRGKVAKTLLKADLVPAWVREDILSCDCSEDLLEALMDKPNEFVIEAVAKDQSVQMAKVPSAQ